MKVEVHLHTSRYSGCATSTPTELMRELVASGYEAVYITDHDAVWADWELEALQKEFPAIRIFGGVEVSVGEDVLQHLLVLGTSDKHYAELGAADVIHKARDEGHLVVLAHPCRWAGAGRMLEEGLLPDAIEYNTGNQGPAQALKAKTLAERLNLPLLNAGDVHSLDFVNRYWIETRRPVDKGDDLREIVLAREYANCKWDDRETWDWLSWV